MNRFNEKAFRLLDGAQIEPNPADDDGQCDTKESDVEVFVDATNDDNDGQGQQ